VIFSLAAPTLGAWGSVFPIAPIAALSMYMAFGKYNGRPSEGYVLKMILYNVKPRQMVYSRVPEMDDLNKKMSEYTQDKIMARWKLAMSQKIEVAEHDPNDTLTAQARKIRQLASVIDTTTTNTLSQVRNKEQLIIEREGELKTAIAQQQANRRR
jgi:hypothetical protein